MRCLQTAVEPNVRLKDDSMIKNIFGSISEFTTEKYEAAKKSASELIERHWTEIESVLISGLIKISEDHLNDQKTLTEVFESAHAVLPLPIRLAIKQETFVNFCFENKSQIHAKLNLYKTERESNRLSTGHIENPQANETLTLENIKNTE